MRKITEAKIQDFQKLNHNDDTACSVGTLSQGQVKNEITRLMKSAVLTTGLHHSTRPKVFEVDLPDKPTDDQILDALFPYWRIDFPKIPKQDGRTLASFHPEIDYCRFKVVHGNDAWNETWLSAIGRTPDRGTRTQELNDAVRTLFEEQFTDLFYATCTPPRTTSSNNADFIDSRMIQLVGRHPSGKWVGIEGTENVVDKFANLERIYGRSADSFAREYKRGSVGIYEGPRFRHN